MARRKASPDHRAREIIERHRLAATGAMFAIPLPGADFAATFAVWARMIREIGRAYGYDVTLADAKTLAGELFHGVVLTTFAWFASAKLATSVLKLLPFAGTVTAYAVDAAIAAVGAGRITATLGTAAAAWYKSGKTAPMKDLREVIQGVAKDPKMILLALSLVKRLPGKARAA